MSRPSCARIDLNALRHNYEAARKLHGGRAMAVLKADAYGHGAIECARALAGQADGFAVAFLEEAMILRDAGIEEPILVLEGLFEPYELREARARRLWIVVHHESQLRMIEQDVPGLDGEPLRVWLKVDSGMGRAGFRLDVARSAYQRLRATGRVQDIVLMTHFSRADEPLCGMTAQQIDAFDRATAGLPGERSLCNSAGVLGWTAGHREWARPGILLYGADPMPKHRHGLRPVMCLESKVFAVRTLRQGDPLGYGGTFVADKPTRVGLVALGYADGYPRVAPTGTPVAVDGCLTRLIGRVSMDMLTIDLDGCASADIGSVVQLWGNLIDVNTVAREAGTVSYELLCNVKRVRRIYTDAV